MPRRTISPLLPLLLLSIQAYACDLAVGHRNSIYNFSLASPSARHPHGILSEDGFYKVAVNETTLWFQLCGQMMFNHDPPICFGCQECGGPSRCGMGCSALVANRVQGYYVCTTIGSASNFSIKLIDEKNPQKGVVVKTSYFGSKSSKDNCSLSVSVLCDASASDVPDLLTITGYCDYGATLRHPSGCAKVISDGSKGWGWFASLMMIVMGILAGYILGGTIYRFFFLGIRSIEAIPNLEFWLSLPHRAKNICGSLIRKFSGRSTDNRGSYTSVSF